MKTNYYELMTDEELENCVIPNTEHRFRMWQKEHWKRFGDGVTIEYEDDDYGRKLWLDAKIAKNLDRE